MHFSPRNPASLFRRHTSPSPSTTHRPQPSSYSASAPALENIPSLNVDYDKIDAEDPALTFSWVASRLLFGFSKSDDPSDPRYRALAKFRRVTKQHGIDDVSVSDYIRALRVYAAMVDRNAKDALKKRRESTRLPNPMIRVRKRHKRSTGKRWRTLFPRDNYSDPTSETPRWSFSDFPDIPSDNSPKPRRWSFPSSPLAFEARPDWELEGELGGSPKKLLRSNSDTNSPQKDINVPRDTVACTSPQSEDRSIPPPEQSSIHVEHVQLLYHMLRHAESIYGFPISAASAPRITLTKMTDRAIICRRTGLAPSDLRLANFSNTAFMPAHYVAVDRQIRAIVICVRGTANLVDSLTDVAATHDPFSVRGSDGEKLVQGYGHSGVVRSARNLFQRVRDVALAALRENDGFEVMVTGHSLGAATAAMLAVIMRDDPDFPRAVAFSFAPLPCMSLEIAEMTDDFVVTVVNGPDIVPRLSVAVLLPYIATVRYVNEMSARRKAMVALGLRSMAVNWEDMKKRNEEIVDELRKQHEGRRLYIPGRVFQLVRRNEVKGRDVIKNKLFRQTEVEVVGVRRTSFLEVRGRERGMFGSHAPFSYRGKLTLALKGLGSDRLRVMHGGSVFRNLLSVPVARFLAVGERRKDESWDMILERFAMDFGQVGSSANNR